MADGPDSGSLFDFGPMAEGYERWYQTPLGLKHDRHQKDLVRSMIPAATPGARLLDVGCGTGHWSRWFASLGYDVTGIDISAGMIESAWVRAGDTCRFVLANAESIPFGDGSFGVITAMTTLEFLADPDAALNEMIRCLRPGGTILIGTLNKNAPVNRDRLVRGKQPYTSARLVSIDELRAMLGPHGHVELRTTAEQGGEGALIVATLVSPGGTP